MMRLVLVQCLATFLVVYHVDGVGTSSAKEADETELVGTATDVNERLKQDPGFGSPVPIEPVSTSDTDDGPVPIEPVSTSDTDDDDDMTVEEEEEEEEAIVPVFVPTHEWQVVQEGQPIPAGLHVRMDLQTGLKEAKLIDDQEEEKEESEEIIHKNGEKERTVEKETEYDEFHDAESHGHTENAGKSTNINTSTHVDGDSVPQQMSQDASTQTSEDVAPAIAPNLHSLGSVASVDKTVSSESIDGKEKRSLYHGKSDRRGIINKRRKVFTQEEVSQMLDSLNSATSPDPDNLPGIAFSASTGESSLDPHREKQGSLGPKITVHSRVGDDLPVTLHEDVEAMLRHAQVLADANSSISELLYALDELEDYAHHIGNARDLNAIGGLVLVVRLLNHSHPDVRSHSAHVIGAASQSNPVVQREILQYKGLDLLCSLISAAQPELVQRRALFAISALLRGNPESQQPFIEECTGFQELALDFGNRIPQIQIKAVTLIADLLNEQKDSSSLVQAMAQASLLLSHIRQFGWCDHASSLIHTEHTSQVEKGLQAMEALGSVCDFTSQTARLQELAKQFSVLAEKESDDFDETLLDHCNSLLRLIQLKNRDL